MNLHTIEPRRVDRLPPAPDGWSSFWHGYFQLDKVRSATKRARDAVTHTLPKDGTSESVALGESEIERQALLNIIADTDDDVINMFELGAGRGDWCLALAGVVDHRLIDCRAQRVRCLAIEGEPTHYQWTKEHFEQQGIAAEAVYGAVYSMNGSCRFKVVNDPSDSYGQSIQDKGEIEVPAYTVDTLASRHGFNRIHLFHMDVQGAEVHALLGAKRTLLSGSPDYLIIGTHGNLLNRQIRFLLSPFYDILLDCPPRAGIVDTPFGKANFPADGLMILTRCPVVSQRRVLSFRIRHWWIRYSLALGEGCKRIMKGRL